MTQYQPTCKVDVDGTRVIVLMSITAMQQCEQKSFEELRLEDYMVGNMGTQGQQQSRAAPAPSAFGQPTPAPAFDEAPALIVIGGGGELFGAPAPAPAPAPATGGATKRSYTGGGGALEGGGSGSNGKVSKRRYCASTTATNVTSPNTDNDKEPDWNNIMLHEPARTEVPNFIAARSRREGANKRFAEDTVEQRMGELSEVATSVLNDRADRHVELEENLENDNIHKRRHALYCRAN